MCNGHLSGNHCKSDNGKPHIGCSFLKRDSRFCVFVFLSVHSITEALENIFHDYVFADKKQD